MPTQKTKSPSGDIFFRSCEIQKIAIKVDYKAKHIDYTKLKAGRLLELVNFVNLNDAELVLSPVCLYGVTGWARLSDRILKIWLPHVRDTQIPGIVSGVSEMKSFVNIGMGMKDMFKKPVEQFQKDGRIVRGVTQGASSLMKTATLETVKLSSKLAVRMQSALESADQAMRPDVIDTYSTSPPIRADQPIDFQQGIAMGYQSISSRFKIAARSMSSQAVNQESVAKHIPTTMLQPIIGVTEALSKALSGLHSTLDQTHRKRNDDKYK